MRKQQSMSLFGGYAMLLAALGLGVATHQRGETLQAMVHTPQQQIAPEIKPVGVVVKKAADAGLHDDTSFLLRYQQPL